VTPTLAAIAPNGADHHGLTPRELEVMQQLVLGLNDREIAVALSLSPATIKHHLKQVYQKLGVHNRTSAALLVVLMGLASPPAFAQS